MTSTLTCCGAHCQWLRAAELAGISVKDGATSVLAGVERRRAHPTTDAPRDRATGNHLPRRLLLRVPRVRAHPKEQARGDGVSCGVGGGERGSGRSSAFVSLLLRLTVERTSALGMHYTRLRTRCTPTDDQMGHFGQHGINGYRSRTASG